MADTKISALTALAGSGIAEDDAYAIVDTSVTTTKKILHSELRVALAASDTAAGTIEVAVQSEQETGTSTTLAVTPGRQQYHPSAAKAWGVITPNTTVSASYPAAGVSVVKNGTGDFTITHGVTFSSVNVAASVSVYETGAGVYAQVHSVPLATTLRVHFFDSGLNPFDPDKFSYSICGDLA